MNTVALVHPNHGTHFVYDQGELELCLKRGWSVRPKDWKEQKHAADKLRKIELLKAEQARLAAETSALETAPVEEVSPPKNKGGRPRKIA